jgi:acyl-CoA hydrolase
MNAKTGQPSPQDKRPFKIEHHKYTSMAVRLIMPSDLNAANRLFGGRLMEWVDEIASLFCMTQLCRKQIVTKKISEVIFNEPADQGDVLEFLCRVKDAGRSSITVECLAVTKVISSNEVSRLIVACDLVFVAIGTDGRPEAHGFTWETKDA